MNIMIRMIMVLMTILGMSIEAQAQQNQLIVPTTNVMWGNEQLPVNVENSDEIVALQFDLTLPAGVTAGTTATLTSRCTDHDVTIRRISGQLYRVMLYSDTNSSLVGESGTVFYVPITIAESIPIDSELEMSVAEAILSKSTGENVVTEVSVGKICVNAIPVPDIVNPGFELCPAVTSSLVMKSSARGIDYEASGWKLITTGTNACSGVFAYGAAYTLNNMSVPQTGYDGQTGQALGFSMGWRSSMYYRSAESVRMPSGTYALLAYVYNANPDVSEMYSRLGFVDTANGNEYLSGVTSFPSDEWTIDYVLFTLHSSAEGAFQVGCSSYYRTASENAVLFYDDITLTDEQDLVSRLITVESPRYPEDYGQGQAMASLLADYAAYRQQMVTAASLKDFEAARTLIKQKKTDIDDYIVALANLTQTIQEVEDSKLSQALLSEARSLRAGIVDGTLYASNKIAKLKSDVSQMISNLKRSVNVYAELYNYITYYNCPESGPDTRQALAADFDALTAYVQTCEEAYTNGTLTTDEANSAGWTLYQMYWDLDARVNDFVFPEEWQILKTAYVQMGNGEGWTNPWNFSSDTPSRQHTPTVYYYDGHVNSIELEREQVEGEFPFVLLTLPKLGLLNLANNRLSGDIGAGIAALKQDVDTDLSPLNFLYLSNNQLTGNIGLFASYFPSLITLDAAGNSLTDVSPAISCANLSLGYQTIDQTIDVSLAEVTSGAMFEKLPEIIRYDHSKKNYEAYFNLLCTTASEDWSMTISRYNNYGPAYNVIPSDVYQGENDVVLNVTKQSDGSTFRIRFTFDAGDSNFDGAVNVYDLQTTINYAVERHKGKFNFTAANLWADDLINVQDVVKLVDVLMSLSKGNDDPAAGVRSAAPAGIADNEQASIYIQDGQLKLFTDTPVAAFDLTIDGISPLSTLNSQLSTLKGIRCSVRQTEWGTRIIGYSLTGGSLPVGETAICQADAAAVVVSAQLSDIEAQPVSVRLNDPITTAIGHASDLRPQTSALYDLQGRRVEKAGHKGLYIQGNRKIVK